MVRLHVAEAQSGRGEPDRASAPASSSSATASQGSRASGSADRVGRHARSPGGSRREHPAGPGRSGRGRPATRRPRPRRPAARRLPERPRELAADALGLRPGPQQLEPAGQSASPPRPGSRPPSRAATASAVPPMPCARARSAMWASRGCSGSSAMARPWAVIAPSASSASSSAAATAPARTAPPAAVSGSAAPPGRARPRRRAPAPAAPSPPPRSRRAGARDGRGPRPRPQPVAKARPEPAGAALALLGRGAADRHGDQPAHPRARREAKAPLEPAVDHRGHALDRQAGLGDVGGEHHLALARCRRPDHRVLLGPRQIAVERMDCTPGGAASSPAARRISRAPGRNTRTLPPLAPAPPRPHGRRAARPARPRHRIAGAGIRPGPGTAAPRCAPPARPQVAGDAGAVERGRHHQEPEIGPERSCASRHKARPRSASSERSWNSSNTTSP